MKENITKQLYTRIHIQHINLRVLLRVLLTVHGRTVELCVAGYPLQTPNLYLTSTFLIRKIIFFYDIQLSSIN